MMSPFSAQLEYADALVAHGRLHTDALRRIIESSVPPPRMSVPSEPYDSSAPPPPDTTEPTPPLFDAADDEAITEIFIRDIPSTPTMIGLNPVT